MPPQPPTLATLPPEIRLLIYPYLFHPAHCAHATPVFPTLPITDESLLEREISIPQTYTFHPALLRTSKLFHAEASAYIAQHVHLVRILTPWAQSAARIAGHGRVRILQVGRLAAAAPAVMEADVAMPGDQDWAHKCAMLLALDDLVQFTRFWWYSSLSFQMLNPQLGLAIRMVPRAGEAALPLRLQERILLPFCDVRGLDSFSVAGPVDEQLVARVKAGMSEPFPSPESCLEACTRLKDEGNALLKAGHFRAAIQKYDDAHAAIFIQVSGRRRDIWGEDHFKQQLESGPYAGQIGIMVAIVLRVKLVANTMQALLKLEDWEEVIFWGERSIALMGSYMQGSPEQAQPGFQGGPEVGKIYYRAALAYSKLAAEDREGSEYTDKAREYYRCALRWLPNDESVKQQVRNTTLRI